VLPDLINIHELVDVVITTLDARDPYTYEHSFRVAYFSELISSRMNLPTQMHQNLHIAAHLHDIGKIGVPDRVLNKPGKLTSDEIADIQTHPRIGYNILSRLPKFREVAGIVLYHHERYDGKGYPDGLKGVDIPFESRIIGVADSFDAMTSDRPYRKGMPFEKAVNEINLHKGTQFDPDVVGCFNKVLDELYKFVSKAPVGDLHHAFAGHEELMNSRIIFSDLMDVQVIKAAS